MTGCSTFRPILNKYDTIKQKLKAKVTAKERTKCAKKVKPVF